MQRPMWVLMLMVGLVVFCSVAATATALTTAQEEARLISGMEVEVSSLHHRQNVGANMLDGDLMTAPQRWISQLGDQEPWFMLLLPEERRIDTLVLYSGMSGKANDQFNAHTFVIEAMQGADWVQVAQVQENVEYRCVVSFPAVQANAWRVRFLQSNTAPDQADNRARIFEVRLLQAE